MQKVLLIICTGMILSGCNTEQKKEERKKEEIAILGHEETATARADTTNLGTESEKKPKWAYAE